jgi:GT2 family glycosyltransferase
MKVAVILLNYNSAADCKKCIGFLKRQESVEMEIVIVDNCSGDDDRLAVEELCQKKGCTFIANKVNKGYNAGNKSITSPVPRPLTVSAIISSSTRRSFWS